MCADPRSGQTFGGLRGAVELSERDDYLLAAPQPRPRPHGGRAPLLSPRPVSPARPSPLPRAWGRSSRRRTRRTSGRCPRPVQGQPFPAGCRLPWLGSCRHLYLARRPVHRPRLGFATGRSRLTARAPRARRLRHRLRAGYAAAPRPTTRATARRRWGRRGRGLWMSTVRSVLQSTVRSVQRSGLRSPRPLAQGGVFASVAPLAGFAFCRHIYDTTSSAHEFNAISISPSSLRRPSRHPSHRLCAGYTALSRRTAQAGTGRRLERRGLLAAARLPGGSAKGRGLP